MKWLTYPLFILILVLLVVESGLRISGKYKTYTERIGKGYHTYFNERQPDWYWDHPANDTFVLDHGEFRFDYTTNQLGLRERQPDWPDNYTVRLATFGDSFTEGVGAAYDSTWPREIERLLVGDSLKASVLNAGVSGSDPFYCYQFLKDKILPLQPTHVIFAPNRTDMEDYFFRSGFERFLSDGTVRNRPAPKFHFIYRHSHLARMYFETIRGYDKTLIKKTELRAKKIEAAKAIKTCLDSTSALCAANNIRFLVVVHVTPGLLCYERQAETDDRFYNDLEYNYPFIYLEDQFRPEVPTAECRTIGWKTDGHFNGKGYTLMGRLIYAEIGQRFPEFWNEPEMK